MINRIIKHIKWKINYWRKISLPQIYFAMKLPNKVLSGPFAGMKYITRSTGSVVLPKLVGTYEDELNGIWEEAKQNKYDAFVDVGAAEGYFATGVSKYVFNNEVPVIAFELTTRGQKQIKELAALNDINTITIKGICTKDALKETLDKKRCLILMDVEGAEFDLLDHTSIDYNNCDILVEVHPMQHDNLESILVQRFNSSHSINVIEPKKKELPSNIDFPEIVYKNKEYLMNEFRGKQSWLWMKTKKFS
jgi:hypothetical protein